MTTSVSSASVAKLSDWLISPRNRVAYRRAAEIFPSRRVTSRGAPPLIRAIDPGVLTSVRMGYLERSFTDAFVVLHNSRLVAEWYAPGMYADTRHILFSVTKSVIGMVATNLIVDRVLDERELVSAIVPESSVGGYGSATVRDLLDMTANIDFTEEYDGPDVHRYRIASGQVPSAKKSADGIHEYIAGLRQAGPHGSAHRYVSPTADMLGWVCERATNSSLAELISRYVWCPMGAEHDADLLVDSKGAARASGGLCATASDMARIGQLLLDSEGANRRDRVGADIRRPGDRAAWSRGGVASFIPNGAYRSMWYQLGGAPGRYLASGIYGQRIYVDMPRRVVIAQQGSSPSAEHETWVETLPLFEAISGEVSRDS
ncbi:serine hydrolase domain-containing protein [Rhodococcus erythropolis]|uniref:serine hydrolase domain-containing protein n=1 Tax=Rhodococcus erythropolis TaxID=1833 RepID=UPI001BE89A12|nr:serine hydrolase [Rhodococcus erythropolis]MBT2266108.1 serine hydrolase [Rhodococcus erythropolis]